MFSIERSGSVASHRAERPTSERTWPEDAANALFGRS